MFSVIAARQGVATEFEGEHIRQKSISGANVSYWETTGSGPLCGVYAACNALEMIGYEASPADFVNVKYLGGPHGSTPSEVASIVEEAGAKANITKGLSYLDLRLLNCPLIANVRSTPTSNVFDHWIVVVCDGGDVLIYDGVAEGTRIRPAEFLALWNGIGITVTPPSSNPLLVFWGIRAAALQLAVFGLLLVSPVWPRIREFLQLSFSRQVVAIGAATIILSLLGQFAFGNIINHVQGVVVASAPFESPRFRYGTLVDARRASESREYLLIDARYERDFLAGTVPSAVNIPVYASIWNMRQFLQDVDRRTPAVVFCQSKACTYDEVVARNLNLLGFEQVIVCDEGYREYLLQTD